MTTAHAHANIALVKYWGKRDRRLNLPAAGSLSLTLEALTTTTTVTFEGDADTLQLDGATADGGATARVSQFLDVVRARAGIDAFATVESSNNFPTASGLASSASAYAALALAASDAAGLSLSLQELSVLARRGSGSAARSIFGGLVVMHAGRQADGLDAFAEPLDHADLATDWPLTMVIAIVGGGVKKKDSSRDAMAHCAATSPLYEAWIGSVAPDIDAARAAIEATDLAALGAITEGSAMAMHAAAMASRPATVYWQPPTLAAMAAVRGLRDDGTLAFHTMDAGPHVKVLCVRDDAAVIAQAVRAVDGVTDVIISGAGGPARTVDAETS